MLATIKWPNKKNFKKKYLTDAEDLENEETWKKNTSKIHNWRSAKNYGFIRIWFESSHEGGDVGGQQRPPP